MDGRKFALIAANYEFDDSKLRKLKSPAKDAEALATILANKNIGNFDSIDLKINASADVIRRAINLFFTKKFPNDTLLFYYSGHGVLDERGRLFLTTKDTDLELLRGTSISASYIVEEMDDSRSKRQILIADCCYSGAMIQGAKSGIGTRVSNDLFAGNGYGRVVLSAANSMQVAWEGDRIIGSVEESLFTHYFIEGITTGNASPFKEWISIDDIYEYIYTKILSYQNPQKSSFKQEGELIISRNPRPRIRIRTTSLPMDQENLSSNSTIFGIDFGTTKSAISIFQKGKPLIIRNERGEKFTPSVVTFTENNEIAVGTPAFIEAFSSPQSAFFNIKRHITSDSIYQYGNNKYRTIDIAAKIFENLKNSAKSYAKEGKFQAVVSVPAYFSYNQKAAISEAAQKAGFEVLRMIPEPVAAALAYGVKKDDLVAICDLGGGTFDVSILELGEDVAEVMAVNGNNALGGIDFDNKIISFLLEEFKEKYNVDISNDAVANIRLRDVAEQAKIVLSELEKVQIFVPNIYADQNGAKHIKTWLSRATFDMLTKDLVDKIETCCRKVLEDSEIESYKNGQVDKLIFVGLSTQIPAIRKRLSEVFRKHPQSNVDPDEAVAIGAAIQAAVLSGATQDVLLLDATQLSLGIELFDGKTFTMVKKNTTIPIRKTHTFRTHNAQQSKIVIKIVQGGDDEQSAKEILGTILLENIEFTKQGQTEMDITFDIDASGVLYILVKEKGGFSETGYKFNILSQGVEIFQDRNYSQIAKQDQNYQQLSDYSIEYVEASKSPVTNEYATDKYKEGLTDELLSKLKGRKKID